MKSSISNKKDPWSIRSCYSSWGLLQNRILSTRTHNEPKNLEISFVHTILLGWPIVLKLCTDQASFTISERANGQLRNHLWSIRLYIKLRWVYKGHFMLHIWVWNARIYHVDGLVQEKHNSRALAMKLRFSCTNPSTLCKRVCWKGSI